VPAAGEHLQGSTRARDCTRPEVGQLIARFIRAFNAGDLRQLDSLFAPEDHDGDLLTPSFQWYSTGSPGRRLGTAAGRRSTLIRYFARRHAARERLTLLSWSGGAMAFGYAHFAFRVIRRARDTRPKELPGKGAAVCVGRYARIAVWSM
jgi:hypothetical protein